MLPSRRWARLGASKGDTGTQAASGTAGVPVPLAVPFKLAVVAALPVAVTQAATMTASDHWHSARISLTRSLSRFNLKFKLGPGREAGGLSLGACHGEELRASG